MKKEDLPQDPGALDKFTREVCYVKNSNGKYDPSSPQRYRSMRRTAIGFVYNIVIIGNLEINQFNPDE